MIEEKVTPSRLEKIKYWLLHGLRDWIALNSVGAVMSLFVVSLEMYLFSLTLLQFGVIRAIYAPLVNLAVFLGAWSFMSAQLRKRIAHWNNEALKRFVVEGAAITAFRMPLYVIALVIAGLPGTKILGICLYNITGNFATGWLNGLVRDWLAKRFKFFNGNNRRVEQI